MKKKIITTATIIFSFALIYFFSVIIGNAFDGELSAGATKNLEIFNSLKNEDNVAVDDIVTFVATHQIEYEQFTFCSDRDFFCSVEELEQPEIKRFLTEKETAFQDMAAIYHAMKSWNKSDSNSPRVTLFLNFHQAYLYHLSQLVHAGKVEEAVRHLVESQKFYTALVYRYHSFFQKILFLKNMQINKKFLQVLASEKIEFKISSEERALFIPKLNVVEIIKPSLIGEFGFFAQAVDGFKANPVGLKEDVSLIYIEDGMSKGMNMASNPESVGLMKPQLLDHVYNYFLQPNASKNEYYNFSQASILAVCGPETQGNVNRRCDNEVSLQEFGKSSFYLRNIVGNSLFKLVVFGLENTYKRIQQITDELAEETESLMSVIVGEPKTEVDPHMAETAPDGSAKGSENRAAPALSPKLEETKSPSTNSPAINK